MSLLTGTSTSRISQMVVRPWDADLVVSFFATLQDRRVVIGAVEPTNKRGGDNVR